MNVLASDSARVASRDFNDRSINIENLHLEVRRPANARRSDVWRAVFHGLLITWVLLILVVDSVSKDFLGYSDLFMSAFFAALLEVAGCGIYLRWVAPRLRKEQWR